MIARFLVKNRGNDCIKNWNSLDEYDRSEVSKKYLIYYFLMGAFVIFVLAFLYEEFVPFEERFSFMDTIRRISRNVSKNYPTLASFINYDLFLLVIFSYLSHNIVFFILGGFINVRVSDLASKQDAYLKQRKKQAEKEEMEIYLTKQKQAEKEAYNKQLQEIEDKEYAKTRGQSRALLSLYEQQLKLLQEHKKRGVDIERETFDLRKKLLELERQENSEMINDLLQTLDRVSK